MNIENELNNVIQYIEKNLTNKINYNELAVCANSSLTRLQKLFLFATNMTISEYIRNRRLTLAGEELLTENIKIIELAFKYGYESAESFSRAFKKFHGMSPLTAKRNNYIKSMNKMNIEVKVNQKDIELSGKKIIRIEEFRNEKAITFRYSGPKPEETTYFMMRNWILKYLKDYAARRIIAYAPNGHDLDEHSYVVQIFLHDYEIDESLYPNIEIANIPDGLYIVGDIVLNEYDDRGFVDIGLSMKKTSQELYEGMLKMEIFTLDMPNRVFIEEQIFNEKWFKNPNHSGLFKVWLPIKRK